MSNPILLTTLYDVKNDYHFNEIKQTIIANCENKYIKKVIVFFEKYDKDNEKYKFLLRDKIEIINTSSHQSYKLLFNYANTILVGEYIIISNTDILFDNTINRIHEINFHNKLVCALTRWEKKHPNNEYYMTLQRNKKVAWSFDSYIFKSPIECNTATLDIKVGVAGCDTLLLKRLSYDNFIEIINPCIDIKTYHIDAPRGDRESSDNSYWQTIDYPAPWNKKNFNNSIEGIRYKTDIFNGVKVTTINNDEFMADSLDKLKYSRKIKVLSFSLWGSEKRYNVGAYRNAELALELYPTWECWFYIHIPSVPKETVTKLREYPNVKIIEKHDNVNDIPMMWRFEAIDEDNVEIMMSRDTDTRILLREKYAVEEWLTSGKTFHIMRDHPHHSMKILGGMFGTRKTEYIKSWKELFKNVKKEHPNQSRDYDQIFLRDYIYPLIKDDCLVHTCFYSYKGETTKKFPTEYRDYHHVGEYVYENESRSQKHIDVFKSEYDKSKK